MALQVQDAAAGDRPQLCLFDGVETAMPSPQAGKIVPARTEVQGDLLIPVGTVGRFPYRLAHNHCSPTGRPAREFRGSPVRFARAEALAEQELSPGGFAADGGDCDVPHRRVGLGTMPVAFTSFDGDDITDIDLTLLALVRHHAGARGHDQHLVAVMRMPARGAALAEVHDAAVVVRGVAGLNDGLACPRNRPGPPFDPLGSASRGNIRYVFERDHLHDDLLLVLTGARGTLSQLNADATCRRARGSPRSPAGRPERARRRTRFRDGQQKTRRPGSEISP